MRLIDADAFTEFLKDTVKQQKYEDKKIDGLLTVADVIEAVISELDGTSLDGFKNAPTIELSEHTEIIHCRDCKNWDKTWTNDFPPNYHYCPMVDGVRKDNFYCADAERKTDGGRD